MGRRPATGSLPELKASFGRVGTLLASVSLGVRALRAFGGEGQCREPGFRDEQLQKLHWYLGCVSKDWKVIMGSISRGNLSRKTKYAGNPVPSSLLQTASLEALSARR